MENLLTSLNLLANEHTSHSSQIHLENVENAINRLVRSETGHGSHLLCWMRMDILILRGRNSLLAMICN